MDEDLVPASPPDPPWLFDEADRGGAARSRSRRRAAEDRYVASPLTVRQDGRVISTGTGPARPLPGPQYATETRDGGTRASAPHLPMTGRHVHEHSAHGATDGTPVYGMRPGYHLHEHEHRGDNSHDHHNAPGRPGPGMPEVTLHDHDPGGESRGDEIDRLDRGLDAAVGAAIADHGLEGAIRQFLAGCGVNPDHALQDLDHAAERRERAARDRVRRAGDIAFQLRRAKRKLEFERAGFADSAPGFTIAKISEAQERVNQLDAELREACLDDPEMIRRARRKAGR